MSWRGSRGWRRRPCSSACRSCTGDGRTALVGSPPVVCSRGAAAGVGTGYEGRQRKGVGRVAGWGGKWEGWSGREG